MQTVIELEDGSGLKLTIAKYYTPKHRSIQEQGITPDVIVRQKGTPVDSEAAQRERDLPHHFRHEDSGEVAAAAASKVHGPPEIAPRGGGPAQAQEDFQLQTARDYLRTWKVFRASFSDATAR